jgi:ribosomal-protein-alanine N-acetyltransferase
MRRSPGTIESPAPELAIQRMRRRHLKGVMAIERQVYPRPWSPNLFLAEMNETRDRLYLVAKLDREVVGYGGVMVNGDEAHITNVAVDPDHHRHKVGTRLLYELIDGATRMGATAVSLEVRVTNWGAQRLYGQFGFRPVGIRKNYYQETNEDALIMWADDIRTPHFSDRLAAIMSLVPPAVRDPDVRPHMDRWAPWRGVEDRHAE